MSMSVDGLISGMDTTALITGLIQAEAAPQAALKTRMSAAEKAASAYRTVNTTFLAVQSAAEAALKPEAFSATRATSSTPSVSISSAAGAVTGSLTFTVTETAATHSVVSSTRWSSATAAANLTTLDVRNADGSTSKGTIALDGTETLAEAAKKISGSELGLTASVVQVKPGEYALQVTAIKSGAEAGFRLDGAETFKATSAGRDAQLRIGTTADAYDVYSSTNTFDGVLPGATLTVTKKETDPVTVTVASNPEGVAGSVQKLVDAVNSALTQVKSYTSNTPGSTAALKGDFSVTRLAGELLNAVSYAVGDDGSAFRLGLELSRDGKVTFDKEKFLAALDEDPAVAQRMIGGTPADGSTAAVPGIAERLLGVAQAASDSATGSLVKLAEGKDSVVKDIKDRIEAWDLRLAKRKEMLTRQFSAMETALSSLKNQSSWLAGQINSLPTYG